MLCLECHGAPSPKCVIRVFITHLERAQKDVYARCLRCVFTLHSRLVTQMFTLRRLLFTFDFCVTVYVTRCVDITAVSALDLIEN